ncbi:hypothetical protein ACIGMX_23160 [Streptomyces aquilus]|uniref:DUF2975 domain-containing protein n=1 Tax=Streptomyces aquilus TaxID=2548456 RepID=A0A3Q9C0M4_9ACTN|nr:hypothetical protein [Streptomyces aquilus]AZP18208.1 hypothetical protein EJC51_20215 [Streptomyces aquilus]
MSEDRKMLEPMATVVSIALRVLLALVTLGVVFRTVHGGWGGGLVCMTDDSMSGSTGAERFFPEKGVSVDTIPHYCADSPSMSLHLMDEFSTLPSAVLLIGGLFLLHQLLKGAARDGIYTTRTASRMRVLGWWLLAGSVVAELIESNLKAAVLAELTTVETFSAASWLEMWSTPYLLILTGLGLLTFARITSAGAAMREDLEGVV